MWNFYYGKQEDNQRIYMTDWNRHIENRPREQEPPGRLVIEDGTVYEIDLECIRCRQKQKK